MCDKEREYNLRNDIPMQAGATPVHTTGVMGYEMSDKEKLRSIFSYHQPDPSTGLRYETIRFAAKHFAEIILANVPRGADRTAAIRKVREAVMTANAGIALNGLSL